MSDHGHYGEYAEARHDHRGEYADERHDHDNEYAERHHRHYDLERDAESLRALLEQWQADLREAREDLRDALERIRQLEDRQPDYTDPEADDDEPGARDEELSPVLCLRVIMTSNGPRQCRLPVDHEPDAACPANPHARPASVPEAGLPRLRPMGACCDRAVHDDSIGWWCPEHGDQP